MVFKEVVQSGPSNAHCSPSIMALRYTEKYKAAHVHERITCFDEREKKRSPFFYHALDSHSFAKCGVFYAA